MYVHVHCTEQDPEIKHVKMTLTRKSSENSQVCIAKEYKYLALHVPEKQWKKYQLLTHRAECLVTYHYDAEVRILK